MTVFRIVPRGGIRAFLELDCKKSGSGDGRCRFPIWTDPAGGAMWHWDGNAERPTISPSVQCVGGCGRHFTIANGEMR